MDRDELEEDRAAFIAGEIGGAVVSLIANGIVISRDAIVDSRRLSAGLWETSFTKVYCGMRLLW